MSYETPRVEETAPGIKPDYNPIPVGTRKLLMAMRLFDEPDNVVDLNANVINIRPDDLAA